MILLILSGFCPWNIFFLDTVAPRSPVLRVNWYVLFSHPNVFCFFFSCKEKRIHEVLKIHNTKGFFEGVVIIIAFVQYLERAGCLWLAFRHYYDKSNLYLSSLVLLFVLICQTICRECFDNILT